MPTTFVITERQNLVLVDLSFQLREIVPDATVHAFATPADAIPTLQRLVSLTGAISGADFAELEGGAFAQEVERLGGWLVCLDERHGPEIAAAGWHQLAMPFSSETAGRLFRSLIRGAARAAG